MRLSKTGTTSIAVLTLAASMGCATARPALPTIPRLSPTVLATRLADADRLAARGCYLCLKEAAAAYAALLEESDDLILARKALENNLMIALREIELRIPDSGARDAAHALESRVSSSYAAYFEALDILAGPAKAGHYVLPQEREARIKAAIELEKEWPASAMKAYFYLAVALNAAVVKELKPQLDAILNTHSQDLALRYRMQAFLPTFSEGASRALLGQETGFGEVHFLLGQRAILDAELGSAHRELTRARELLPDSASIALVLANVMMAFARYPEALSLFDRVQPDAEAQLGRAKALSYMGRHRDAIAVLDDVLRDLQNNPGEKYYWRAWNRLRLGDTRGAYDDAVAALQVMRNNDVYRLAGVASLALNRLSEAREHFNDALAINGVDCDAHRYLAQIESVERDWKKAFARLSNAVDCYNQAIARMIGELTGHEKDITGLSNALIASLRSEIKEAEALRAGSAQNAELIANNIGSPPR